MPRPAVLEDDVCGVRCRSGGCVLREWFVVAQMARESVGFSAALKRTRGNISGDLYYYLYISRSLGFVVLVAVVHITMHGIELSNASTLSAISPIESSRADAARRHVLSSNHKTCLHS